MFADNLPSQKEYDHYYRDSNKYTYSNKVPDGLTKIYRDMFSLCESVIMTNNPAHENKRFKVLDVGCSIGYFLNMFKSKGYRYLNGVEPSETCSRVARELYEIDVFPGILSEYKSAHKFDLIILTGVLEHISDFNGLIPYAARLLKESGIMMAAVPDAKKFSLNPQSPFDEFSFEHINYFTNQTLSNLLSRFGMKNIYSRTIEGSFYDTKVLVSFYKKSNEVDSREGDSEGISRMRSYIEACNKKSKPLEKKIDGLIKSDESLIVWGVGSLTYRLLATTNLGQAKIQAFVDSNESLQGKRVMDKQIVSPDLFYSLDRGTVFIASHIYKREIENVLKNKYKFRGKVISL